MFLSITVYVSWLSVFLNIPWLYLSSVGVVWVCLSMYLITPAIISVLLALLCSFLSPIVSIRYLVCCFWVLFSCAWLVMACIVRLVCCFIHVCVSVLSGVCPCFCRYLFSCHV